MKNLKLKSARAGKDMSQQQLADAVGVSRQTINAIEKGDYNPTIRLCVAICRALGKTLDELFLAGIGGIDKAARPSKRTASLYVNADLSGAGRRRPKKQHITYGRTAQRHLCNLPQPQSSSHRLHPRETRSYPCFSARIFFALEMRTHRVKISMALFRSARLGKDGAMRMLESLGSLP